MGRVNRVTRNRWKNHFGPVNLNDESAYERTYEKRKRPRVKDIRRRGGGRRSRIFLISRKVIIGYLAEILILQAEGGAYEVRERRRGVAGSTL